VNLEVRVWIDNEALEQRVIHTVLEASKEALEAARFPGIASRAS